MTEVPRVVLPFLFVTNAVTIIGLFFGDLKNSYLSVGMRIVFLVLMGVAMLRTVAASAQKP
ncbi:MAG: hypothetical protein AAFO69_14320, partial [Bacteroidota bacterium]